VEMSQIKPSFPSSLDEEEKEDEEEADEEEEEEEVVNLASAEKGEGVNQGVRREGMSPSNLRRIMKNLEATSMNTLGSFVVVSRPPEQAPWTLQHQFDLHLVGRIKHIQVAASLEGASLSLDLDNLGLSLFYHQRPVQKGLSDREKLQGEPPAPSRIPSDPEELPLDPSASSSSPLPPPPRVKKSRTLSDLGSSLTGPSSHKSMGLSPLSLPGTVLETGGGSKEEREPISLSALASLEHGSLLISFAIRSAPERTKKLLEVNLGPVSVLHSQLQNGTSRLTATCNALRVALPSPILDAYDFFEDLQSRPSYVASLDSLEKEINLFQKLLENLNSMGGSPEAADPLASSPAPSAPSPMPSPPSASATRSPSATSNSSARRPGGSENSLETTILQVYLREITFDLNVLQTLKLTYSIVDLGLELNRRMTQRKVFLPAEDDLTPREPAPHEELVAFETDLLLSVAQQKFKFFVLKQGSGEGEGTETKLFSFSVPHIKVVGSLKPAGPEPSSPLSSMLSVSVQVAKFEIRLREHILDSLLAVQADLKGEVNDLLSSLGSEKEDQAKQEGGKEDQREQEQEQEQEPGQKGARAKPRSKKERKQGKEGKGGNGSQDPRLIISIKAIFQGAGLRIVSPVSMVSLISDEISFRMDSGSRSGPVILWRLTATRLALLLEENAPSAPKEPRSSPAGTPVSLSLPIPAINSPSPSPSHKSHLASIEIRLSVQNYPLEDLKYQQFASKLGIEGGLPSTLGIKESYFVHVEKVHGGPPVCCPAGLDRHDPLLPAPVHLPQGPAGADCAGVAAGGEDQAPLPLYEEQAQGADGRRAAAPDQLSGGAGGVCPLLQPGAGHPYGGKVPPPCPAPLGPCPHCLRLPRCLLLQEGRGQLRGALWPLPQVH